MDLIKRAAKINDVVKSSVIEDEYLNPQEVRSSIARRLGMDVADLIPVSRDVEGFVGIARRQYAKAFL